MKVKEFYDEVVQITTSYLTKKEKAVNLINLINDNRDIDISGVIDFFIKSNFEKDSEYTKVVYGTFLRLQIIFECKKYLFLQESVEGMILGGSMSYGPFYNVRHYDNDSLSSDIDLIVITTDNSYSVNFDCLSGIIKDSSIKSFKNRKELCAEGKSFVSIDTFSHRFIMKEGGFYVSIHFITKEKFKQICSLSTEKQGHLYLLDYKEDPYRKDRTVEFSVCGTEVMCETPSRKVDGGFIAKIPWYGVVNGEIVPGLFLNNISPRFNVIEGSSYLVKKNVQILNDSLVGNATYKNGSIYKAHIRRDRFIENLDKIPNLFV